MDYPKSVPSVGLLNGKFVDENPVTGQVGSLISSDWGNAVTDELLNVIRAGGEEPAEAEHDQLLAAIKAIVRDSIPPEKIRTTLAEYGITDAYTKSVTYTKAEIEALLKNMSALPVGAMVPFPKGTVPAGFLEVDGSVQSAATYPDLAAYLGTAFNTGGEGAGNFRLPESRGEFLRGWDHGRGVDAGRVIGSEQQDALQNITGESSTFPTGSTAPLNSTGAFKTNARSGVPTGIAGGGAWSSASFDFDASRVARTATETRPRNLAVMWCIKAWNAPRNQGNIDVAALAADVQSLQKVAIAGSSQGLRASASGASSIVNVVADQLVVGNDLTFKTLTGINLSINSIAQGADGLDTGSLTGATWFSVWVIWNGSVTAGLLSLSATTPVLPAGYSHKARVGWIRTDVSANKYPLSFVQIDEIVQYKVAAGSNVPSLPNAAGGVAGDISAGVWVAVDTGPFVPPTARRISLSISLPLATSAAVSVAPNSSYGAYNSSTNPPPVGVSASGSILPSSKQGTFILESKNIYWASSSLSARLYVFSWEDSL
ncbi:microcystin-dependent protein [Pseudomonas protegens]|uniref:phage tail protein n=1 Tax=Pseudomonas protegens TaxID=380021 RepID=UPI003514648D